MSNYEDPSKGWPGGDWLLSAPDRVEALWGDDREVAWPKGEAFILVGGDGSGKTILAGNLLIRQAGIVTEPLFGMTIEPRERILYLAQDRPQQAKRSLKRLIGDLDRESLNERLAVVDWPIGLIDDDPERLVTLAREHGADTVYVDSLKDVVSEPSGEESGLAIKRAYAEAIAAGVEVCLLHHDRKAGAESKRKILKLADVYGSRFITAGAGSVVALNGGSGDPIIDLRHLKQPDEEVGPHRILLDFATGEMSIHEGTDILAVIVNTPEGLTANDAARVLYETDKPTRSDKERARRKLQSLADSGLVVKKPGVEKNEPDHYVKVVQTLEPNLVEGVHAGVHEEVF